MPEVDRRRFLQLAGGSAALSVLSSSIARAASIPANRRTGSLDDVEHIVVLMQENRSFDHYFGTHARRPRVRRPAPGHAAATASRSGDQPDGTGKEVLPFRPDLDDLGLPFLAGPRPRLGRRSTTPSRTAASTTSWVPAKGTARRWPTCAARTSRSTTPWPTRSRSATPTTAACSARPTPTATTCGPAGSGNDGKGGGPVIGNAEAGYDWTTYPERLQKAGVSWKIYQDIGNGLDARTQLGLDSTTPTSATTATTRCCTSTSTSNAKPGDPLYDKARTGTDAQTAGDGFFDQLTGRRAERARCRRSPGSWRPRRSPSTRTGPPNYGAWYISQVLDALTTDPEVWSKTALFITYDENDGFFDHMVPPYPNVGALQRRVDGATRRTSCTPATTARRRTVRPRHAGADDRSISPWSTGGWVCSEVFDHTSIIRFMEQRFGVHEPNITPVAPGRLRRPDLGVRLLPLGQPGADPAARAVRAGRHRTPPERARGPPAGEAASAAARSPAPGRRARSTTTSRSTCGAPGRVSPSRSPTTGGGELTCRPVRQDVKGAPFSYTLGRGKTLKPVLEAHGPLRRQLPRPQRVLPAVRRVHGAPAAPGPGPP